MQSVPPLVIRRLITILTGIKNQSDESVIKKKVTGWLKIPDILQPIIKF